MVSEADVRAKWVEICLSYDGCSIAADPDRFTRLISADGAASVRQFFSQRTRENVESSCGVVSIGLIRELCRAFGLRVPELEQPMSSAWLDGPRRLAQRHGCEVTPAAGRLPTIGCAYYLYEPTTKAMHWRNIVDGVPGTGPFTTIDGGQKDASGFQSIAKVRPHLRGSFDVASGKPIAFWIDAVKLVMVLLAKRGAAVIATPSTACTAAASGMATGAIAGASPLEGIDVSSVQGKIDWQRVAKAGISFAYLRALIGRDDVDTMLATNAAGAKAAGVPFGLYGVVYPRMEPRAQDADIQAAQLANLHAKYGAALRPMLDVETLPKVNATSAEWLAAVELYATRLDAVGLSPIVYTYPAFWRALKAPPSFAKRPLWLAHYTSAPKPDVPPPWTSVLLWQYLASAPGFEGRVDGVSTLVDRNRLFGGLDAIRV